MKVCFTGPRPNKLWGYVKVQAYTDLVHALADKIIELYNQGYNEFITGGAQGFDQLSFWAVNIVKEKGYNIKNIVYVPFKGQELRWSAYGLFSQKEYRLMLKLADEVIYLYDVDASDYKSVVKALYGRNHVMCNNVDLVIGLYKDLSFRTERKSGTAECLRYAESIKKHILLFDKDIYTVTDLPNNPNKMFRGENYYRSNMFPCHVNFEGIDYSCSESAYQAHKCVNEKDKLLIAQMDGYTAKREVKKYPKRKDWHSVNLQLMYRIVKKKFAQNPDLAEKLIASNDEIVEVNTWGDKFWGVCNGIGVNNLGKILMRVRSELKDDDE